jgi:hypothetical protein
VEAMPHSSDLAATCPICRGPLGPDRLYDPATARGFHPDCVVGDALGGAAAALAGALALVVVPLIFVWAA